MWDLIVSVPDHCLSFYFYAPHPISTQCIFRSLPAVVPFKNGCKSVDISCIELTKSRETPARSFK